MESQHLKNVIEAAMLAAGGPLSIDQLKALFGDEGEGPEKKEIREVIKVLQDEYAERGIELREVASGFRIQVRESMGQWLGKLFEERPPRYTRALMETLAIIAYRQPVTRGDIEEIRGVAVSTNIIRTLLERDWIKVVGHRDVPGKPAMFGTTRFFLDYFGLKKLDDLPPLAELAELEPVSVQLELGTADQEPLPEEIAPDDAGDERADSVLDDVEAQEDTDDAGSDESYDPSLADDQLHDQVDDELDDEVSDEELAAALAVTEAVDKVVSGAADEDANIASLEDARDRSTRESETDFNAERAEVVPIKQS
ncbi:MAG: SMC-Scp complex subunit ScpB [Gammaproteobacteria bacterium]|nr:SMC-Scp complex subunit ScpB [Gammaproteobacteria bacterium]